MKTPIVSFLLALTLAACGGAPDEIEPAPQLEQPAASATTTTQLSAPSLEGTWVSRCSDTTTTIEITAADITIVIHVDGQGDQVLAGAYSTRSGHIILNQDGAELDLGAFYLLEGDALAIVGAFSGVYHRAP